MAMPVAVPRYTLEDLAAFPDDGNRYELVDGFLLVTPAPLPSHEVVVSRIARALTLYFGGVQGGQVLTHGAVEVRPNVHMEPDILVVPEPSRVPDSWLGFRTWWLAVEVSGRGSRIYDRDFKRPAYLRAGVDEVWRADLRERCVFVATPKNPEERRVNDSLLWLAPGRSDQLRLDVSGVFEGVSGDD